MALMERQVPLIAGQPMVVYCTNKTNKIAVGRLNVGMRTRKDNSFAAHLDEANQATLLKYRNKVTHEQGDIMRE